MSESEGEALHVDNDSGTVVDTNYGEEFIAQYNNALSLSLSNETSVNVKPADKDIDESSMWSKIKDGASNAMSAIGRFLNAHQWSTVAALGCVAAVCISVPFAVQAIKKGGDSSGSN